MAINPEYEAACEITRILRFPLAIDINTFHKGDVELLNFKVEEGGILHEMRVQDIHSNLKCDILVSIIERGEEVIIPNGEFMIKANDTISIIASHKKAMEFFVKIGMVNNPVKSTMLIGGGDLSYYLAKKLLKYGIGVTIIEKELERCEKLSELIPKAMVIHGDGTDKNLLIEEGIKEKESFATAGTGGFAVKNTSLVEYNMFVGACAGSTGGGIKVSKIIIAWKNLKNEMFSFVHPKSVHIIRLEGKKVAKDVAHSVNMYLVLYLLVFIVSILLISIENYSFETNFTAVATALNNVGPGLDKVGPVENFGSFHPFSKCVFMFDMLAGRLELVPMVILCSPGVWRRNK